MGTIYKSRRISDIQKGFTLIELMIVIAIIGVFAAIAVPKYRTYMKKVLTVEVKLELANIRNLQVMYHGNEAVFGSMEDIGWTAPTGDGLKYTYRMRSYSDNRFKARGEGNLDGDACIDRWSINEKNELKHERNDISGGNQNRARCRD